MPDQGHPDRTDGRLLAAPDDLDPFLGELARLDPGLSRRVRADPENADHGLAALVLALVDLLRQLMERQALRRMDGGRLTDEEIERLGQTFMRLEERMEELKDAFGLTDDDLRLNLGPLGDLT
jgi:hypothetical protein